VGSEGLNSSVWKKRLTYVTTSGRNTTARFASVGTIISAQMLRGVRIRCPRCDATDATLWRRFDYFEGELPLYFTKCRRCLRRRSINADEAAFRLVEVGIADPMGVLHEGLAVGGEPPDHDHERHYHDGDDLSVREAKQLVVNRQRAYGKKHSLTFAARAQLAEAFGRSGEIEEAARAYAGLLSDQIAAEGHQSPAVLVNRYRASIWTAHAGDLSKALTELEGLLPDEEKILGKDHVNTLITRTTVAQLVGQMGDRERAVQLLREVSGDQLRVLGSEHPTTETTQRLLAEWDTP
jgi:hypothetical protein